MAELVFLKLGGSVITDKKVEARAFEGVIRRVAQEVGRALAARPDLRLVLGHGSGSFGHFVGQRYGTRQGIQNGRGWLGYAKTGAAAARLNRLVTDIFLEEDVPVVSIQPSASALCRKGELIYLEMRPIEGALAHQLVPLVYGDVALDEVQGCTIISTEQIFVYLAGELRPDRIILAGLVEGVFSGDPLRDPSARLLKEITSADLTQLEGLLTSSHGVDVTGGMLAKVRIMLNLVCSQPSLSVRLISGRPAGLIEAVLSNPDVEAGTLIRYSAGSPGSSVLR